MVSALKFIWYGGVRRGDRGQTRRGLSTGGRAREHRFARSAWSDVIGSFQSARSD
jgi:hypothetical protein